MSEKCFLIIDCNLELEVFLQTRSWIFLYYFSALQIIDNISIKCQNVLARKKKHEAFLSNYAGFNTQEIYYQIIQKKNKKCILMISKKIFFSFKTLGIQEKNSLRK